VQGLEKVCHIASLFVATHLQIACVILSMKSDSVFLWTDVHHVHYLSGMETRVMIVIAECKYTLSRHRYI